MAPTAGRTAPKSRSDGAKCRSNGPKCQSGDPQPSVERSPSAGLTASSAGRLLLGRVEPLPFRDALLADVVQVGLELVQAEAQALSFRLGSVALVKALFDVGRARESRRFV